MSRQIVVDIIGDASRFTKATKDATASAGKMNKGMKAAFDGLPIGFLGVAGAATALTGALVKGVQGAIEEERGIARLGQVLQANVADWDGNTEAIEASVKARTDMGFADDELRDSLAKLVPATKDVNKAFDVQSVAMDLARLKGISLTDASQALVKVEAGQYRALKDLGIVLKDGATQTEALAAVQAVAQGQAAAYMDTTAGKAELVSKRFDELTESIGSGLLPALNEVLGPLSDVIGLLNEQGDAADDSKRRFESYVGVMSTGVTPAVAEAARGMDTYAEANAAAREPTNKLTTANKRLATSMWLVAQSGAEAAEAVRLDIGWMKELGYIKRSKRQQRAAGGAASGMTWVGEQGPELVDLPTGSFVHSNAQSRQMAGGGGITVNVAGSIIGPSGVDELMDIMARRLRLDGV